MLPPSMSERVVGLPRCVQGMQELYLCGELPCLEGAKKYVNVSFLSVP
jgi:hypothetical protein